MTRDDLLMLLFVPASNIIFSGARFEYGFGKSFILLWHRRKTDFNCILFLRVRKKYKKRNGHIGGGLSIEGGSNLLYTMIFKGWKEGIWSPELLGGLKCRGPDFKGGDLRPLFVPWSMENYKLILSTTETAGIK